MKIELLCNVFLRHHQMRIVGQYTLKIDVAYLCSQTPGLEVTGSEEGHFVSL